MKDINHYLSSETIDEAFEKLKADIIEDLIAEIKRMDDDDIYEIITAYDDDFVYPMRELDEVFDHYTVTEVLEELSNIDTSDRWFNRYGQSSDYLFEVSGISVKDLASWIVKSGYDYDYEINKLFFEVDELKRKIIEKFDKIKIARELFEVRLNENVDEVISLLWN